MNAELANHVVNMKSEIQQVLMNNKLAEVIVHTDACMNNDSRKAMEINLRNKDNMVSVRLNKPHLLIISYNRDRHNMTAILQDIQGMGYRAQLIGM